MAISIHAPTWGATRTHLFIRCGCQISIHAPTWGATSAAPGIPCSARHFNPRTHVGCDSLPWRWAHQWSRFQSTHPRGVRRPHRRKGCRLRKFQSTHPRGVRLGAFFVPYVAFDISIHAPTWGATNERIFSRQSKVNFNPRTHVGCDRHC